MSFPVLAHRADAFYNRRVQESGYSPYYFAFGVPDAPPGVPETYEGEMTYGEEIDLQRDLVRTAVVARDEARANVASNKAQRDHVRAILSERKALSRIYAKGDWVLLVRNRSNKQEPYYSGPYCVTKCHAGNSYDLSTPGGVALIGRQHGQQLFPAYAAEGQPIRSLWYASKRLLQQDRQRLAKLVDQWRELDENGVDGTGSEKAATHADDETEWAPAIAQSAE